MYICKRCARLLRTKIGHFIHEGRCDEPKRKQPDERAKRLKRVDELQMIALIGIEVGHHTPELQTKLRNALEELVSYAREVR